MADHIVIAGASLAGLRAGEALRRGGHTGRLTIVGAEPHLPYNRPPLSKQVLLRSQEAADLAFDGTAALNAEWKLGSPIERLFLTDHRHVLLASGERVGFDQLVIATGVSARPVPGDWHRGTGVHVLRNIDDALRIDREMGTARHVTIIGAGFIGCEVAATCRERGIKATMIDTFAAPLERALGVDVGGVVADLHHRHGVHLRLGVTVTGVTAHRGGVAVALTDGSDVIGDLVVAGLGTVPTTGWLEGNDLDLSDGVLCDDRCRVLDEHGQPVDGVVAAGDIARWPNRRFDGTPRRVEHWSNAIDQAAAAAATLLGNADGPYEPVPWFWSEQYGVRIQSVGLPYLGDQVRIVDGDVERYRFVATYHRGGDLVGAVAFDSPRTLRGFYDELAAGRRRSIATRAA